MMAPFAAHTKKITASALFGKQKEIAMLLDELRAKKSAITALCNQYGARRIRVFGSVAKGEERPDSDVDLIVEFPRGYDLFAQRLPLTERLQDLLRRRVELIPET